MSLKLVKSIANDPAKLAEISSKELDCIIEVSIANNDMSALNTLLNHYTGLYDYDERKPWWLESEFTASVWELSFGTDQKPKKSIIKWSAVILSDGYNLTSPKHTRLLNAFKYWVTATGNPHENGGKVVKVTTVKSKVDAVINLINAILLHGKTIDLANLHLESISEDFVLALLVNFAEGNGVYDGIYGYTHRVKALLIEKITSITDIQAAEFKNRNTYITRTLLMEEQSLGLLLDERIKACCWLDSIGYYSSIKSKALQGNGAVLGSILFKNKIIPKNLAFPTFDELWLDDKPKKEEYRAIPNKNDSENLSYGMVSSYIDALKLLHVTYGKSDTSQLAVDVMRNLKVSRVNEHVQLKKLGRSRTLQPHSTFKLIRQCYEFTTEKQESILHSVLSILVEGLTKSSKPRSNPEYFRQHHKSYSPGIPSTVRGAWLKKYGLSLVDESLITAGVKFIKQYNANDKERHHKIRNNESLFELYNILIGSVQTLIGSIMARRQDELVSLKSHGNLVPNIDPYSTEGKKTEYYLEFKLKKSGNGGKYSQNTTVKRPIVHSFAKFVWQLELFNQKAEKHGLSKGALGLFNNLDSNKFKLTKTNASNYNQHLNVMCDYFETDLVEYCDGEFRRNYIRQHQLRRFFAMVFFWSKGFDGLESLRWMLGHTDLEHLYHYISESEEGAILNESKASILVQVIKDKAKEIECIDNIDKLENVIAQRYGAKQLSSVMLSTVTNTVVDYEDTDEYKTIPHISQLKAEQKLESHILELLEDEVITLEPNFFTITNENGEVINTFTLALEVKELD